MELRAELSNLDEWRMFEENNRHLLRPENLQQIARRIKERGFHFRFINRHVTPAEMSFIGDNYRETISFAGLISRQRALLEEFLDLVPQNQPYGCAIYSPEALTATALLLKSRYPRYYGSEYTESNETKKSLYPIPIEDLSALTLQSNSFDAVLVQDVFEHLPFLPGALSEICRVLKPGGVLISSFPFNPWGPTLIRARRTSVGIEYLAEPEYHGDPVNKQGALVYQIPGWDILQQAKAAGFSRAHMVFLLSEERGIIANHSGGIMLLVAVR